MKHSHSGRQIVNASSSFLGKSHHTGFLPQNNLSPSHLSNSSEMLDVKVHRKRAESDLQLLANRIALLRVEEQKAINKFHETKARAEEILELVFKNCYVLVTDIIVIILG